MTKYIVASVVILCSFLLSSSNRLSPQKYLDTAVVNSGKVAGFAGDALSQELKRIPVRTGKHGETVVITRQELIEDKISFSRKALEDLKNMYPAPDAFDIVTSSIGLHEFVIGVYETDYMMLAKMYDEGIAKEKIAAFDSAIKSKYASMFELHYENLVRGGKLYAAKHNLSMGDLGNQF